MLQQLITLQAQAGANNGSLQGIIMIVLLFAIFYFLMIRPQQKKQKEIRKFRESLRNGDHIITAGGIYGKIKDIKDSKGTFLIQIADGVLIEVDKGSVYPSAADAAADAEAKK
jgi:preprotein translocase subunit YajC